jgi:phosphoglycerate dehydrogenase-like enzyme
MSERTPVAPGTGTLRALAYIDDYAQLPRTIDAAVDEIRTAAGTGAAVHVTGDRDEADRLLSEVDVAFGHFSPERLAAAAPTLRWVHLPSAGVERYMIDAVQASGVTLTSSRGIYSVWGAEHVIGMMLMFNRCLKAAYDAQKAARWDEQLYLALRTLRGQTLGIVGLGGIGTQLAIRARAFEMDVVAVKRERGEKPPYVDRLWGQDGLGELLAASDHVAITLPLTPRTRGLIGASELARMKPTAYLYNIGRGAVVDEPALIHCLEDAKIAGAGLDVFTEEPLPPASPLWRLPNVIITPHHGASSPGEYVDAAQLFARNLRRYRAGEELVNVVDFERGY